MCGDKMQIRAVHCNPHDREIRPSLTL